MKLRYILFVLLGVYGGLSQAETAMPWKGTVRVVRVMPSPDSQVFPIIGGRVTNISKVIVPELALSYNFTPTIAAEFIMSASKHRVNSTRTTLGNIPLGTVTAVMPTLFVKYHFGAGRKFNPYLGIGLNYTSFNRVSTGPAATSVQYNNSMGPAADLGMDVNFKKRWTFNVDFRKTNIRTATTVVVSGTGVRFNTKVNPWVFGIGLGYRF